MNRLRYAFIPVCISFGPLFMTQIGGIIEGPLGNSLLFCGAVMLMAGLGMMFEIIFKQEKKISILLSERDGKIRK